MNDVHLRKRNSKMHRHNILFLDDEKFVINSITRELRKERYTIFTATDTTHAFSIIEKNEISVLISDYCMPIINGVKFITKAKAIHPDCVCLILSGITDTPQVNNAIKEGHIYKCLLKPWNRGDLKKTIVECINIYECIKSTQS